MWLETQMNTMVNLDNVIEMHINTIDAQQGNVVGVGIHAVTDDTDENVILLRKGSIATCKAYLTGLRDAIAKAPATAHLIRDADIG